MISISNIFGSQLACGNTSYGRSKSDFYPTPPEVTQAILNFLEIPKNQVIWECAAGDGHMAVVMTNNGYETIATDINKGWDFLDKDGSGLKFDWIITNPPFSLAEEFIRKAWSYGKPFAMLLKSQYWHASKRAGLFMDCRPTYVLPLTWRPDFLFKQRGKGSPVMEVLWCVWNPADPVDCTKYYPLIKPEIK